MKFLCVYCACVRTHARTQTRTHNKFVLTGYITLTSFSCFDLFISKASPIHALVVAWLVFIWSCWISLFSRAKCLPYDYSTSFTFNIILWHSCNWSVTLLSLNSIFELSSINFCIQKQTHFYLNYHSASQLTILKTTIKLKRQQIGITFYMFEYCDNFKWKSPRYLVVRYSANDETCPKHQT